MNKKRGNKRGLSAIVANLLIILLVIVAVGIVWVVVSNILDKGTGEISFDQFAFDLDIDAAYVQDGNVNVVVGRNAGGGDLNGIAFIFHNGTDSVAVQRLVSLSPFDIRSFTFTPSEVAGLSGFNLVSISPIYQSGGEERTGNILDTREIGTSGPGDGSGGAQGGAVCGNNVVEGTETCDDGNVASGDGCSASCQIETPPSCNNNGQIDSGEYCDGTDLGGETCQTLGYDGGDLLCNSSCAFDTSQCTVTPGGNLECSDGIDNDADGSTDLADIGCVDANDNDETNCGDGVCEGGETTNSCSLDCQLPPPPSCNGTWTQEDIDDGNQCDGGLNCTTQCVCQSGYIPDENGGCVLEPALNFGTVDSVWPGGAVKYFDSDDLPKTITITSNFTGKYVNFSGVNADTRCLRISYAEYLNNPSYDKSYIRVEVIANISSGNLYSVWSSATCGV